MEPDAKPRAYSYIRFSRPEQMRGDSLRRQQEAAKEWADEKGIEIDVEMRDFGISAFTGANRKAGELGDFLDLVEKGLVPKGSFLIVENLDRLSRENALEFLPQFAALITSGIVIVTLTDGVEHSLESYNANGNMLNISLGTLTRANEESRLKSMRLQKSWKKKRTAAQNGIATRMRLPAWISFEEESERYVLNEKSKVVKEIFAAAIAGKGRRRIATDLNSRVAPWGTTKRREPLGSLKPSPKLEPRWHPSYIKKIIQHPAAYGRYQPYRIVGRKRVPDGPPLPGYFPAAVDEGEWYRANAALDSRTANAAGAPAKNGTTNVLRGLARCGSCGSPMARENKGRPPKGTTSLICSSFQLGRCGNGRRWRIGVVERLVLARAGTVDAAAILGVEKDDAIARRVADLKLQEARLQKKLLAQAILVTGDEDGMFEMAQATKASLAEARETLDAAQKEVQIGPDLEQQSREFRELLKRWDEGADDDLADLRLRVAQELRKSLLAVEFSPNQIVARQRTTIVRGGRTPNGYSVTVFDDSPETLRDLAEQDAQPYSEEEARFLKASDERQHALLRTLMAKVKK